MALFVVLLLFTWSAGIALATTTLEVELTSIRWAALPFGLAVVWAVLQTAPFLPLHLLRSDAATALGTQGGTSVSIDPTTTLSAVTHLLVYAAVFWLSLQYCRDTTKARTTFHTLTVAGFVYAAYGLIVEFSGTETILWYPKMSYEDVVTSTFVNRNSYATYAGLGLVCTTGLIIKLFSDAGSGRVSIRERIRSNLESLTTRGWLLFLTWVILASALLLTESRAGLTSTVLALLSLLIVIGITGTANFGRRLFVVLPFMVGGITLFFYSGEEVAGRLARTDITMSERLTVYELTTSAIGDNALLGTGYGTFEDAFRLYGDDRVKSVYDLAHNTYLENALELGIPAAILLVLAIASLFIRCLIGVRTRRRNAIYPAIGVAATVLVATHSLADFSLQIPAVAVTYALIMGAAVGQSWPRQQ